MAAAAGGARRLRVLVVITRAERGGAQVHVRDLLAGLRGDVELHLALGEDGFLADEARGLGVPVHLLGGLQRDVKAAAELAALRRLRRLIGRLQPDLVHTHSTKAGLLGRLAAWSCGVPRVHTAHAWAFSDGQPASRVALAVPAEAAVGLVTDRVIAVSEADREVALRWRVVRPDQVTVVHNGLPDHPARARPGDAPAAPVIACVARMAHPKDHALLLEALARIELPFELQLIGDGPQRAELDALATRLGLQPRLRWLGVRGDVPELLAQAHLFALVSLQEGFPISILEAMRAGLAVVASDVGGVSEAVSPETGRLVPRGDRGALIGALSQLLADPSLRAGMGRAGRRAFESRFSEDQMLQRVMAVYTAVARGRQA